MKAASSLWEYADLPAIRRVVWSFAIEEGKLARAELLVGLASNLIHVFLAKINCAHLAQKAKNFTIFARSIHSKISVRCTHSAPPNVGFARGL